MQELMFDVDYPGYFRPLTRQEKQAFHLRSLTEIQEPIDVFRDLGSDKIYKLYNMKNQPEYLGLAIDAIRFFFWNEQEDNPFYKNDLYCCRYVDTYPDADHIRYQVNCFLFDHECWCKLLETEPLHIIYDSFVRPLCDLLARLFLEIEEKTSMIIDR